VLSGALGGCDDAIAADTITCSSIAPLSDTLDLFTVAESSSGGTATCDDVTVALTAAVAALAPDLDFTASCFGATVVVSTSDTSTTCGDVVQALNELAEKAEAGTFVDCALAPGV
jgi:hypothetical protein